MEYFDDAILYGLYEDLYIDNTYSVEDVYEDYWKEKNGDM